MKAISLAFFLAAFSAGAAITKDPGPIPELRPIRDALPPLAEEKKRDLLPWFIGAGIFAILAAMVASRPKKQGPPPPPAYVTARKELEGMSAATATPLAVSTVLRNYMLAAFHIPARGATTAELLQWVSAHPSWDTQLGTETAALLDACDEAKFAPNPAPQDAASTERVLALIARIEGRRTSPGSSPVLTTSATP